MTDDNTIRTIVADVISIPIMLLGALLAFGLVDIHRSSAVTALTGIALLLTGRSQALSFTLTLNNVTKAAFRVWRIFGIAVYIFTAAALVYGFLVIL